MSTSLPLLYFYSWPNHSPCPWVANGLSPIQTSLRPAQYALPQVLFHIAQSVRMHVDSAHRLRRRGMLLSGERFEESARTSALARAVVNGLASNSDFLA